MKRVIVLLAVSALLVLALAVPASAEPKPFTGEVSKGKGALV